MNAENIISYVASWFRKDSSMESGSILCRLTINSLLLANAELKWTLLFTSLKPHA